MSHFPVLARITLKKAEPWPLGWTGPESELLPGGLQSGWGGPGKMAVVGQASTWGRNDSQEAHGDHRSDPSKRGF